jgi:PAS domain S-box-containing protein
VPKKQQQQKKKKPSCKLTGEVRERSVLAFDPEERLRLIMESARDFAIFTTDCEGIVTTWNRGAERILGYAENEIVGCNADILFTPEDRARGDAQREIKTALKTGRAGDDRWHMRKDGSRFWGSGLSMALRAPGEKACGILKVMRDLTERKKAELALERSTKRLRAARDSLEKRVEERTKKYREANRKLREQIEERRALERAALEASEREQRRIGQDLHDTACQHVAGLSMIARTLARRLGDEGSAITGEVDALATSLRELGEELREVTRGLYPVELERNGLMGALQELCQKVRARRQVRCRFVCREPVLAVSRPVELHLYRIAQESVTNAVKHSGARQVTISLERNSHLLLEIKDDGRGFDPQVVPEGSMGLQMMRYRANVVGADLSVRSSVEEGTLIKCLLKSG